MCFYKNILKLNKGEDHFANRTQTMISIPFPSVWGIDASIAGRPIIRGILTINSIIGTRVMGTVNFRGTPIPIIFICKIKLDFLIICYTANNINGTYRSFKPKQAGILQQGMNILLLLL